MNKIALNGLAALLAASFGLASAATDTGGVRMSTDPARAAAVEQHARDLQTRDASSMKARSKMGASKQQKHSKNKKHHKQHTPLKS
jgi:hypothetical protein